MAEVSLIEYAKTASDMTFKNNSKISTDIKEILKYAVVNPKRGVIVEIPWEANVNQGIFMKTTIVIITKVTKERVYFDNPLQKSDKPSIPIRKESEGKESIALTDLLQISRKTPIKAIIQLD